MSFHFQHLFFSPSPTTLWIGLLVLAGITMLSVISWRRSPNRRRTALLESLRLFITLLIVALLWKPEWQTVTIPHTRPEIAILWDGSKSMETVDAELPKLFSPAQEVVSRADWNQQALKRLPWNTLSNNGTNDVSIQSFSQTPEGSDASMTGTNLSQPLEDLLDRRDNLRAVVMLSDGDFNQGEPPIVAAQKMLRRNVPLFTIPIGSKKRLPDLDLISITAPAYGIVGENVQIPFTIRSSLSREVRTVVRLRDGSGLDKTKDIVIAPGAETYDAILWKIEKEGPATLELSIPLADGERIETNNARKFTLSGRPESIHVLVIDTLPRWEYRYLRNALSRDPGVELSCLLLSPQLGKGDGPDYIQEFPEKPEELSKYDVIILGDVGIAPDQLTKEQCGLLRGMVDSQASGIVFLPGKQGNQFTLLDSPLADLLPVQLDEDNKHGFLDPVASPMSLTSEGRGSLLTMLADSEEGNPDVWRSLPGFYWHAPALRAKGGTEVLAVHATKRGRFGPVPIIVTKAAGTGKVLFMGIDSAWRWRRGVEDKYHYRFWGQVARWMSYQRNMAAGQRVRLYFSPERPAPGATVTLNANAFDANGAPLQEGNVMVDATAPDGSVQSTVLEKNPGAWGSYTGRLKISQPGSWKLKAYLQSAPDQAVEALILAQGIDLEKTGQPARPEVLDEMSRITRGRMVHPDELEDLMKEIRTLPQPRPQETRLALWSHWASLTLVIGLLAIFWTGRKLSGAF